MQKQIARAIKDPTTEPTIFHLYLHCSSPMYSLFSLQIHLTKTEKLAAFPFPSTELMHALRIATAGRIKDN